MDGVSEYAACYGGLPDRDRPWHEFASLLSRTARFAARDLLAIRDGTRLSQTDESLAMLVTSELRQQAAGA